MENCKVGKQYLLFSGMGKYIVSGVICGKKTLNAVLRIWNKQCVTVFCKLKQLTPKIVCIDRSLKCMQFRLLSGNIYTAGRIG